MSVPAKLVSFVAGLGLLFGVGLAAGAVVGPDRDGSSRAGHGAMAAADPVRGLAVAADGLRLEVGNAELPRGRAVRLGFRIVDESGKTVRDFDVEHDKRMHLILARRDLTGFQHLHPEQRPDGSWEATVRIDEPGSYRMFADFTRDERTTTLASDLRVDGAADMRPLPPATDVARTDGYEVALEAAPAKAGEEAELKFTVSRDGVPVRTERYLGAGGHLVALREGDLAFLHVHPAEDDTTEFETTLPTAGSYRLFLQFKHDGAVHTAAFTRQAR